MLKYCGSQATAFFKIISKVCGALIFMLINILFRFGKYTKHAIHNCHGPKHILSRLTAFREHICTQHQHRPVSSFQIHKKNKKQIIKQRGRKIKINSISINANTLDSEIRGGFQAKLFEKKHQN